MNFVGIDHGFRLGVSLMMCFFFFLGVSWCLQFIVLCVFSQQLVSKLLIQDGDGEHKF